MLSFSYGNKKDHKAKISFDEPTHRSEDISHMLGVECSLTAHITTAHITTAHIKMDRCYFHFRMIKVTGGQSYNS